MRILVLIFSLLFGLSGIGQTYKVEEVNLSFEVSPTKGINSKYTDFAPVVVGDQVVFTSGRESDLVLLGENNWKNTGFLNLFTADIKGGFSDSCDYKNVELFASELANNNHTGPVCFTPSGDTIFFTQVANREKKEHKERRPQLYMAVKVDKKWDQITLLPFCDPSSSFGHPSWDAANQQLYFASDMKGGLGGKDIYTVSFKKGVWGVPKNLTEINSSEDDMFPMIAGQDLFFASNRAGGKGGLDLYWKIIDYPKPLENLEALNTSGDEFGIFVTNDKTRGLYTSGTNGNDDILYFNMTRSVTVSNELAGQFTFRNLNTVASGLTIQLFQDDDLILEQQTDAAGEFKFSHLPYENYTFKAISEDDLELIIYDVNGNATAYLLRDGEGAFQYKKIDYASAGTLSLIPDDMTDFDNGLGWISGQFAYENLPGEYSDSLKVMLVDEDGNIAFTQYTDKRGNFDFRNLPLDKNYILTTEAIDDDLVLYIYDKKGNVVAQLKQNEDGQFVYKKIKPDLVNNLQLLAESEDVFESNTMTVTGNFNYKKLEGQFSDGLTVYIFTEDGILVDSTTTNALGQFRFSGLNPEVNYLFKIDESDPNFKMEEFNLYVEDRFGNAIADLYHGDDGYFIFKQIETVTENNLVTIDEGKDNFELKVPKDAVTIYFDKNSSYPDQASYESLSGIVSYAKSNKDSKIYISAYTDSRSTDIYNMYLSEKRGNRIKDYLVRKGISTSRIEVKAYGESQLVNGCGDEADCPEEEHAKNRRVEVVISKN